MLNTNCRCQPLKSKYKCLTHKHSSILLYSYFLFRADVEGSIGVFGKCMSGELTFLIWPFAGAKSVCSLRQWWNWTRASVCRPISISTFPLRKRPCNRAVTSVLFWGCSWCRFASQNRPKGWICEDNQNILIKAVPIYSYMSVCYKTA